VKTWVALVCLSVALAACSPALVPQRSRVAGGEAVTCRNVVPTGSHLPRTVCTTAAERREQEQAGREMIEEEQRRRMAEETMRRTLERPVIRDQR
jgi:hypothetical protein